MDMLLTTVGTEERNQARGNARPAAAEWGNGAPASDRVGFGA
jgi:hypothetical protein